MLRRRTHQSAADSVRLYTGRRAGPIPAFGRLDLTPPSALCTRRARAARALAPRSHAAVGGARTGRGRGCRQGGGGVLGSTFVTRRAPELRSRRQTKQCSEGQGGHCGSHCGHCGHGRRRPGSKVCSSRACRHCPGAPPPLVRGLVRSSRRSSRQRASRSRFTAVDRRGGLRVNTGYTESRSARYTGWTRPKQSHSLSPLVVVVARRGAFQSRGRAKQNGWPAQGHLRTARTRTTRPPEHPGASRSRVASVVGWGNTHGRGNCSGCRPGPAGCEAGWPSGCPGGGPGAR